MTEEEAQEKWCPMVRFAAEKEEAGANRWLNNDGINSNPEAARCLGSECMMWRVSRDGDFGYCGLAGK